MNSGPRAKRERFERLGRLFEELTGLDPLDRDRLIAARCEDDDRLAAEVRELLTADASSRNTGFVERLLASEIASITEAPQPDLTIGPWRVVRRLGGAVARRSFLVDREEESGMMRAVLRTFPGCAGATEGAATAFWRQFGRLRGLDASGLARMLGAGIDPDGTPYVAVEVVEGERITTWCERRRVSLPERVELFVGVCDVVAGAHARGIAHGGLRASRVVVGGDRRPKLLDFGIESLAAVCDPTSDPPTPRDDVLALGQILFELMTGTRPLGAAPAVAKRGLTASRAVSDARTRMYLESGLDAVVRRALRTEPVARYSGADGMAEDLRRHLRGLPVLVSFEEGAPPRRSAPPPTG
jgi:hypothetical protein